MADKAAERIKYETELLRLVFVLVIAVGGSSLSLLLGSPTPLRLILAGAGSLATWAIIYWLAPAPADSGADRPDPGAIMTGAEIIAAFLGVTLFAAVVIFAWKITSH